MKSFVQLQKGRTPRQAHTNLDGLKDDELGRGGFSGRVAQLYRRHDPTRFRTRGDYRPWEVDAAELAPADASDARGLPLRLFWNDDCRIALSRRATPMPFYVRYVGGDVLYFVHRGTGLVETEFGPLRFEPGDYVVVPKAVTHRLVPDGSDSVLLVLESRSELQIPDYGILGRHAPFDPTLLRIPEPEALPDDGHREWEVVVVHGDDLSSIFYDWNPCDVDGWKGDLFPFALNIRDWNPIMSDSLHLPPTVSQFVAGEGIMVCNFLPRPAESREGVERVPCYHRNADWDELAFYHGGSFLGFPLPAGMIALSPQGLHHGAPEKAREVARAKHHEVSRIDWEIIAIDTRHPLRPTDAVRRHAKVRP
jgi:homogentisate 1,2-dioxygenase